MVKSGNSSPPRCALNVLRCYRGEVPYERLKGLDPRHISRPSERETPELIEDIRWNLRTYEPRVKLDRVNMRKTAIAIIENGDFESVVRIIDNGGD